jgi:hypothetical protein
MSSLWCRYSHLFSGSSGKLTKAVLCRAIGTRAYTRMVGYRYCLLTLNSYTQMVSEQRE